MSNYSIFLPSYSVGEECYKEIPYVTRKYGKKAVAIGGKTAMSKAKPELLKALEGTDFEITDFIWYGGDSNYENVEILKKHPEVINADMLFGIGGGRACDTVKILADMLDIWMPLSVRQSKNIKWIRSLLLRRLPIIRPDIFIWRAEVRLCRDIRRILLCLIICRTSMWR